MDLIGLSSGIVLISSLALIVIFIINLSPIISIFLITALAGGTAGFLPFNKYPAKTFVGDVGAQFMGFMIAVIAIVGVAKTYTMVVLIAPIVILAIPIFDTLFAIVRRIIKNKSFKGVFMADAGHIHNRLLRNRTYCKTNSKPIIYYNYTLSDF